MFSLILRHCIRVSQNLEVNLVSQLQMMDLGCPVCGNIWVKYKSAIFSPVALVLVGHASIHPLKQSLYMKIESYQVPFHCEGGNGLMKSMEKCVPDMTGMSGLCRSSAGKVEGLSSIAVPFASVRKEEGLFPDQSSSSLSRSIPGCTSTSNSLSASYASLSY